MSFASLSNVSRMWSACQSVCLSECCLRVFIIELLIPLSCDHRNTNHQENIRTKMHRAAKLWHGSAMEHFRKRGTTGLPENLGYFVRKSFLILFQKQPSLLLNEEVICQASDSSLSKELYTLSYLCRSLFWLSGQTLKFAKINFRKSDLLWKVM